MKQKLFLTARIESADKIAGFQVGADDYIIKPFDLDELEARVAAQLRKIAKMSIVDSMEAVE